MSLHSIDSDPGEMLTVKEVSKLLKIPVGSIYQMTFKGEIPFFKIGHRLRFDKEKVISFFKDKTNGNQ